jgi:hypothetical protein
MRDSRLTVRAWQRDVLILMPPTAAYSVWWFFEEDVFRVVVNLDEHQVGRHDGVQATYLVLDTIV